MTYTLRPSTAAAATIVCAALVACSARDRPDSLSDVIVEGGTPVVTPRPPCVPEPNQAPGPDAVGLCGNLFLDAAGQPPNLYFVIDRSGSMQGIVDGRQKYAAVADAAVKLVRSLGAHANVGAAVFPAGIAADTCGNGEEVFPPTLGDLGPRSACQGDGPVTGAFSRSISLPSRVDPRGSTPTAATLVALTPRLAALPGTTAVVLATDGGPNCNAAARCTEATCIPNIEGECPDGINCCDVAAYGPRACLDSDPTRAAVADLKSRGIKTYVVGVPGSAPYRALLSELAIAGGTARESSPAYYEVARITELDAILGAIGAAVTVSCDLTLSTPPPAPGLVNVYLDRRLITYGTANGWRWSDTGSAPRGADADADAQTSPSPAPFPTRFQLLGAACDDFERGRARQLQVTFGCPTEVVN